MSLQSLVQQLETVYDGKPWYGDSILAKVNAITTKEAFFKVGPEVHSIAEIIAHMTVWRNALIEWLNGNDTYIIEPDSEEEWPLYGNLKATGWDILKENFIQTQQVLIAVLQTQTDESLGKTIGPKKYVLRSLLEGIIQHDIYHLGQIGLLVRQTKMK